MDCNITAVIPTCNRPDFLLRALNSVLGQTYPPDEIVVVNDGELPIPEGVSSAAGNRARFTTNRRKKGASGARNAGVEIASGKYIAFLDDDDEWLAEYLESAMEYICAGYDLICADFWEVKSDGRTLPEKNAPEMLFARMFFRQNPGIRGSNIVIRKSIYQSLNGFDESIPSSNDLDFGIRASLHQTLKYTRNPKRLVRFHQHSDIRLSMMRSVTKREGLRKFYSRYSAQMTDREKQRFLLKSQLLWGVNQSEII